MSTVCPHCKGQFIDGYHLCGGPAEMPTTIQNERRKKVEDAKTAVPRILSTTAAPSFTNNEAGIWYRHFATLASHNETLVAELQTRDQEHRQSLAGVFSDGKALGTLQEQDRHAEELRKAREESEKLANAVGLLLDVWDEKGNAKVPSHVFRSVYAAYQPFNPHRPDSQPTHE